MLSRSKGLCYRGLPRRGGLKTQSTWLTAVGWLRRLRVPTALRSFPRRLAGSGSLRVLHLFLDPLEERALLDPVYFLVHNPKVKFDLAPYGLLAMKHKCHSKQAQGSRGDYGRYQKE